MHNVSSTFLAMALPRIVHHNSYHFFTILHLFHHSIILTLIFGI